MVLFADPPMLEMAQSRCNCRVRELLSLGWELSQISGRTRAEAMSRVMSYGNYGTH